VPPHHTTPHHIELSSENREHTTHTAAEKFN
jgi:hypothetical protein